MFNKPFKDISIADVYDLIENHKQGEGYMLDFKGAPQEDKFSEFAQKMAKIFSSFANSYGGYVIMGVDEGKNGGEKKLIVNGVSKLYGRQTPQEWLNKSISSNIEPMLYYPDAIELAIEGSDKVVLVYYIPESSQKPHFDKHEKRYFCRINDNSEPANHYMIRDMFETTRRRYDELNDFLAKRNLLDEDADNFGLNSSSKLIKSSSYLKHNYPEPLLLISFIPKFPQTERIRSQDKDFISWLEKNNSGYEPCTEKSIFHSNSNDLSYNLYGVLCKDSLCHKSYAEFQNNGYLETGLTDSVFYVWEPTHSGAKFLTLHITYCVGYVMTQLSFIKNYYERINYEDEVTLQLSFRNVLNHIIIGTNGTSDSYSAWHDRMPKNETHNHFKIIEKFIPSKLTEESILLMSKNITLKILFAFGLNDISHCFRNDKIDIIKYQGFRL